MMSPASLLILETTGETAITCAHHRKKFQPVSLINPTNAHKEHLRGIFRKRYNGMAPYWLNPGNLGALGSRAAKMAGGVAPKENSRELYWDNTSQSLFKTITLAEVELQPPGKANIGRVADIVHGDPIHYCNWALPLVKRPKLKAMLQRYCDAAKIKSILEVIQNLCTHMSVFMEEPIADCLSKDQIRIGDLRRVAQTLIIMLPLETLGANDRFLSYFLAQALIPSKMSHERFMAWDLDGIPIGDCCQRYRQLLLGA